MEVNLADSINGLEQNVQAKMQKIVVDLYPFLVAQRNS